MQRLVLAKRAWLLLILASCAVYFYGLGRPPLSGPDEPRYAQVAREMFERGDAVTPTLNNRTWFEKPSLLYWMMMLSYAVFGTSEWGARFGPACSGLLTALFVALLARKVERAGGTSMRGFGLSAAAVSASMLGLIVFAHAASFDIILTMTVAASLACFLAADLENEGRRRRWLLAGFYAGMGASLLAKGLVGIVIPCGVVGSYLLMRRDWSGFARLGILWGPIIVLAVAATWYAPVTARHGWKFIDEFILQHHFARYVSNKYRHPQPFYFYIPILALLSLPWTAFLVSGLNCAARTRWRAGDAGARLRVFSLAWLIVPVAFFSLSGSKLPGYILPALPGGALLVADRLARFTRGEGSAKAMRATGVLALLFGVGGAAYCLFTGLVPPMCALVIAVPVTLIGVFAVGWSHRRVGSAAFIVAATFLSILLVMNCALDGVVNRHSVRDLLARAAALGYGSAPVYQLHTLERTSEFYGAGRLAYDPNNDPVRFEGAFQVADAAREHGGPVLVLVPNEFVHQLTENPTLQARVIADNGELTLVAVEIK